MIFLVCVASSVMTPARPTSEPVPAVVGTATIGAMPVGVGARPPVADILEIPHRPRLAGHEGDDLAGIERRAAAEGDDAVMAARAKAASAGLDVGLDRVAAARRRTSPPAARRRSRLSSAVAIIGSVGEARIGDEQRPRDAGGCGRPRRARRCGRRRSGRRSGSSSWR